MRKIIAGTVACLVLSASLFAVPIDPPVVSKLGGTPAPNAMQIQGATGMTPLQVQGVAGATSDVELHDHITPAQHLAIDANGQIGINNFPAGGGGTDVAIHDFTVATRHLTVDASGQIGINNFPASFGRTWTLLNTTDSVNVGNFPSGFNVNNFPATYDTSDRAGRLLGRIYGSQGNQLLQTPTNFNTQVEVAVGATLIDPRAIRALTSSDVVTVNNTGFNVNNFPAIYDTSDRAARLLGVVYGSQGQQLKQTATNFNLQSELAVGGTLIDPRAIRALTSSDVVTTVPPTDATTNITKFGGTNISTGTGAGGAGIPRVTISNDSSLAANQSVNVAQMNGVATSMNFGVPDTGTQRVVQAQAATYSASTTVKTNTTAGTGPFFNICGSGTKTIRVQQIIISGTVATAAVWGDVILKKTSAATTAGTATTLTNVPLDSNSGAATATVKYYTALGTAGTLVGAIASQTQLFPVTVISATLQPNPPPLEFKWRDPDSEAPTLRGTAQCVEANFGTTTTNAPTLTVAVKWTEI